MDTQQLKTLKANEKLTTAQESSAGCAASCMKGVRQASGVSCRLTELAVSVADGDGGVRHTGRRIPQRIVQSRVRETHQRSYVCQWLCTRAPTTHWHDLCEKWKRIRYEIIIHCKCNRHPENACRKFSVIGCALRLCIISPIRCGGQIRPRRAFSHLSSEPLCFVHINVCIFDFEVCSVYWYYVVLQRYCECM